MNDGGPTSRRSQAPPSTETRLPHAKHVALLSRIGNAARNPGTWVMDAFCVRTTLEAAPACRCGWIEQSLVALRRQKRSRRLALCPSSRTAWWRRSRTARPNPGFQNWAWMRFRGATFGQPPAWGHRWVHLHGPSDSSHTHNGADRPAITVLPLVLERQQSNSERSSRSILPRGRVGGSPIVREDR